MLVTLIQKNMYMDSVELMVLSKKISTFDGVNKATVMMGTKANKDIMEKGGFGSEELEKAQANDMIIAVDTEKEEVAQVVLEAVKEAAKGKQNSGATTGGMTIIKSFGAAKDIKANLAVISLPGQYAAEEAKEAISLGQHVMMFSDNVSYEEELELKEMAHEKGLLVMGPDCGTCIIHGVPLAFANVVKRGNIGIVGASGTGTQELTVMMERMGGGISHAIGTGGRDLSEKIGAITMKDAIYALHQDPETEVLVVLSKPPAEEVKAEIEGILAGLTKPVVVLFMGAEKRSASGNVSFAATMEEVSKMAVELSGITPKALPEVEPIPVNFTKKPKLVGLYSGGTLSYEAAYLAQEALGIPETKDHTAGYILQHEDCEIVDLGDDVYTNGKPHPMMDSTTRKAMMLETLLPLDRPAVVLLDVVLGYGASADPSAELIEAMAEIKKAKDGTENEVVFVVNLLGTKGDFQGLDAQEALLQQAGTYVYHGNGKSVEAALLAMGAQMPKKETVEMPEIVGTKPRAISHSMERLLSTEPKVLNIGLKGFAKELYDQKVEVTHFDWRPVAGGDKNIKGAIDFLNGYEFTEGPYRNIAEANEAVLGKMRESLPCLVDVVPAMEATDVFGKGKLLLHAGPPMKWEDMPHPIQGSCVGAVLFEEWAATEEEAWEILAKGEVEFMPCHHADFVGPMGGITSPHMAVLKVYNVAGDNYAYCTMNEGIGQVLRFGAYGPAVVERLRFMRDILGPTLSKALQKIDGGINCNVMVSKAIAMGDEFHQRNIAASLVFLKEVAPIIVGLDIPNEDKERVIKFLADTDQFFLNIMMATSKAVMDYAATVKYGTVTTVMSRNGYEFGVRCAGMDKEWFTAPVNTPKGLYFTGFTEEDASKDMGDSAITETFGVGGMAMIAAPAVTRFVGTGGFYDALEISNRMSEITISHNGMFAIPTWDFKGTTLGIDITKVAATGILPVINTGIAHKVAGKGQIGAGTVNPPVECFTKAVLAYAKKLGYQEI